MNAVIILALLYHIPSAHVATLPDAPKPKVEAKSEAKKPGLLRSILHDRQTITLAVTHAAAATADIISTVHWERKNRRAFEVGYPFHGGRPGVPAMTAKTLIEVGAAALLAHQMLSTRFKIMRVLSAHASGARRNCLWY